MADPREDTTRVMRRARSALSERTRIEVTAGQAITAIIGAALALGGWMWRMQEQINEVRTDVAVIRATVAPSESASGNGRVASNPNHSTGE